MFRRVLFWFVVAAVVLAVSKNPSHAAATARSLGIGLGNVGMGIGEFFAKLVG